MGRDAERGGRKGGRREEVEGVVREGGRERGRGREGVVREGERGRGREVKE